MTPPRFIVPHLAHPRGLMGRLVMQLMNRHNAKMNAEAVRLLALAPQDRVLEIGFGGGLTLAPLLEAAALVGGVDRSRAAVDHARRRFAGAVKAGRADLREGLVEAL